MDSFERIRNRSFPLWPSLDKVFQVSLEMAAGEEGEGRIGL